MPACRYQLFLKRLNELFCFCGDPGLLAVCGNLSLELVPRNQLLAVVAKLVSLKANRGPPISTRLPLERSRTVPSSGGAVLSGEESDCLYRPQAATIARR